MSEPRSEVVSARSDSPLLLIAAILSLVMGLVVLLQIVKQQDVYFVNKMFFGFDYDCLYTSSLLLREGRSLYLLGRYVSPPLPAILNIPLTYIPFETAALIMGGSVFLSVFVSFALMCRIFDVCPGRNRAIFLVGALVIICFSYPFCFLLDRGNIDGWVLFLLSLGMYFLHKRRDGWAGVVFALAVSFKVYPALVVLPLMAFRRFRALVFMGLAIGVLFALMPGFWIEFLRERMFARCSQFRIDENASIVSTFFCIGTLWGQARFFASASYVIYFALLALLCHLDVKRRPDSDKELCARIAMYFPFMVALPALSYHYELVLILALIPVVCWLWSRATLKRGQLLLLLLIYGIALSQFQAVAVARLSGNLGAHFVPGFGLFLIIVGVVLYRMHESFAVRQEGPIRDAPARAVPGVVETLP